MKQSKPKIGLTTGKFLPFHKGHELLLQIAAINCDVLYVVVGVTPSDPFSFEQRERWIHDAVETVAGASAIVLHQSDVDKFVVKDADGTATDEAYWQWWINDTKKLTHLDCFDFVFTSDLYGKRIAKEFAAVWIPIDPDREIIQISGTKVRNDLNSNFHMLPEYVRQELVKVVSIIGPESCGKSTIVTKLAAQYDVIPEYGRIISVNRENDLTVDDFWVIANTQQHLIDWRKADPQHPIIVTDTDALATALYADLWFGDKDGPHKQLFNFAENQHIDEYIVLAPTVPWINDGTRVMSAQQLREDFFNKAVAYLEQWGKHYEIVDETSYAQRYKHVINIISKILPNTEF